MWSCTCVPGLVTVTPGAGAHIHLGTLDWISGVSRDNKLTHHGIWKQSAKHDVVMSFRVDLNCILQQHSMPLSLWLREFGDESPRVRCEIMDQSWAGYCGQPPNLSGWVLANSSAVCDDRRPITAQCPHRESMGSRSPAQGLILQSDQLELAYCQSLLWASAARIPLIVHCGAALL